MTDRASRKVPVLLGTAVSIALVNVLGTLLFNLSVWEKFARGAVQLSDAYARIAADPTIVILTYAAQALGASTGGFTASALSSSQPYLNALFTGALLMLWYAVMYTTPIQVMASSTAYVLAMFALPIPSALAGAYVQHRMRSGSAD
jgi:hypothetical protein